MNKDNYIYPAVFEYAEDGISISFPDLPGCFSCAGSDEEAYFMARDAMRGWLLVAEECGDEISAPTPLKDVVLETNQRAVLIDVNLAFYREAYRNRAVKKTLTIPAWLNDLAEKEHVNFSFVLQTALKEHLNV
ncbi:MAG: type II toxin-antitoxin system HicB family antitoxin [Synergistes sp.]|nr:type II toxin-antitoxin system HicB family antitoxin [Synergistes sp.]